MFIDFDREDYINILKWVMIALGTDPPTDKKELITYKKLELLSIMGFEDID